MCRQAIPIPSSRRRGGFTLAEMLMVCVILAIAAAVVVPRALDTSDFQAVSAARTVAADLEYARDLAITSAQPVTVTFNVSGDSYRLTNTSGDLIHPITKAPTYVVDFAALSGFDQVDVLTASFNGSSAVTFDETGAPDQAGSVTLQAGPYVYRIEVASATGKVTVAGS